MTNALNPRGSEWCRGCAHEELVSVLDLGAQPLANRLLRSNDEADPAWPLHLKSCPRCGLGQVGEFVPPAEIFGDYPYLSSMSSSWMEHVRTFARQMVAALDLGPGDLVVEVASNDGHLLKGFQALAIPVLGIEPATNVAGIARAAGVPTENAFFGVETARRVREAYGIPRLIAANNVLAHVPDLDDFLGGFVELCDADTVITIENPTYTNLLMLRQFDTIYHEHFSYLSAHAVRAVARRHGLELVQVDELPTHGGSNRYWLKQRRATVDDSVTAIVERELQDGLLEPRLWKEFAVESRRAIELLRTWFSERRAEGARIAGYGAAAKGNTLLNAAGISAADLVAVTDRSPEKQGRYLPGSHAPVVAPETLANLHITDVLVLPWNIAGELIGEIGAVAPQARTWVAIPEMHEVAP